jgi:small subunit ribosomal protein S7
MKKFNNNDTFNLFVNLLMKNGKKIKAFNIFIECLSFLKKNNIKDPIIFIDKAIYNIQPLIFLKKKTIKGRRNQVPNVYNEKVRKRIGIKWIIESAKTKNSKGKPFSENLCNELIDCFNKKGLSLKKRDALHAKVLEQKSMLRFWP